MKIALLPSNQVTNATAIRGKSESDLQHAIAVEATADLVSRGIDAKMFWEAEGELSQTHIDDDMDFVIVQPNEPAKKGSAAIRVDAFDE